MSTLRLTTISNQTGSASVPSDTVINGSAKAWVNFNGTGTVAIRASFNVSSITDNGTGDYTVNFTNALEDANYSAIGSSSFIGTTNYVGPVAFNNNNGTAASVTPTTTALRTVARNSSATPADPQYLYVAIFR